jgi:hypothetical protein
MCVCVWLLVNANFFNTMSIWSPMHCQGKIMVIILTWILQTISIIHCVMNLNNLYLIYHVVVNDFVVMHKPTVPIV